MRYLIATYALCACLGLGLMVACTETPTEAPEAPAEFTPPVLLSADCEYFYNEFGEIGGTLCETYEEASDERDAMEEDGDYRLSDICPVEVDDEFVGWGFRWCYEGEEESECNINGEGCGAV
jgi:hypothetical protein